MNKQSLYLFGGALMATTALSSAGHAATIRTSSTGEGIAPSTTTLTPFALSTLVFSATTTTANSVTIGGATTNVTANNTILIDYAAQITTPFNVELTVTNASFTGTPTLTHYRQTTGGTLEVAGSVSGCSVQTLPERILISNCDPALAGTVSVALTTRVDAIGITGASFTSAGALATAGQSIALGGTIRNTNNTVTFESITSVNYVTSKDAIDAAILPAASVTVDNNATPAFTTLTGGVSATTATLLSIKFSATNTVGTDLSFVVSDSIIASSAELKITHPVLSDTALVSIALNGDFTTVTKTSAQFVSGTVSFQVPGASIRGANVLVTFNGTSTISTSTGGTATLTPTVRAPLIRTVGAVTGNLTSISRGGLSVELNGLFPTAGQGSTLYRSIVRIANTSSTDGVATITVRNDITGALIGSFTTSITAGATKQISSADIETAVTAAASAGAGYKLIISGSFNGYAQNLLWNSVSGLFTDLSGFRNGALSLDP